MCQAEQGRGMKRWGPSYRRIYQSYWVLVLGKILTKIQGSPRVSIAQWTVQVIVGYGLFIHFGSLYSHTYGFNHGWKSMSYALYHCYYLRLTLWKPIVWPCMLQFSFSFATSFLFHLIPLVATGEDSAPWMILTLLSWDLCPSYLTSSSLIIGLIISSTGSLTPVCVPHFHHVLLSSIRFLFYMLFLGPCVLVHSI